MMKRGRGNQQSFRERQPEGESGRNKKDRGIKITPVLRSVTQWGKAKENWEVCHVPFWFRITKVLRAKKKKVAERYRCTEMKIVRKGERKEPSIEREKWRERREKQRRERKKRRWKEEAETRAEVKLSLQNIVLTFWGKMQIWAQQRNIHRFCVYVEV